jgi:cyclopropane-fatty-acyl-phospholipid synthase
MKLSRAEALVTRTLSRAGIDVGGNRPWDIQVRNSQFYRRVLASGTVGLGEAYTAGWWDCDRLDEFFCRVISMDLGSSIQMNFQTIATVLLARFMNLQARHRAFEVGEKHYDLGNDLYRAMLDRRMIYSCAYWKDANNLDEAQEAKLDLVCRKLDLTPGLTVLDIGCGWGGFAIYAAEHYGVNVVGVTISKEQFHLAQKLCAGLPIEIRLQDFRDIRGEFDRIVSIGMLEHVGTKNYRDFVKIVHASLKPAGVGLLHSIFNNVSTHTADPWIVKYIFPNGVTPSLSQFSKAMEGQLVVEDIQNIGPDYEPTCLAWNENFERSWPELKDRYGESFRRMWRYYLLMAAGNFRARSSQVLQCVVTRQGDRQPRCRQS